MRPEGEIHPFINEGEEAAPESIVTSPSLMKGWHAKGVTG